MQIRSTIWMCIVQIWLFFVLKETAAFVISSQKITISTIWQFPNDTWVENIAVRSNGQLLVTIFTSPELYQVDPFKINPAQLIHQFPNATGLLGIAEVEHDVFAIAVEGNASGSGAFGPFSVWRVSMREPITVSKIADFPAAGLLNGMTTLNAQSATVLIADSVVGVVYRLNTRSGNFQIVIDDPTMKVLPGGFVDIGVNGVHIHDSFLYYTNTNLGTLVRIPINLEDGTAVGQAEVISHTGGAVDDFAIDRDGTAFVCTNVGNTLLKVTPNGTTTVVAGSANSTVLYGPPAAQFGRTVLDKKVLYVTTTGGLAGPIPGVGVIGGGVLSVTGLV